MLAMLSRPREAWLIGVGVVAAFLGVFLGKRVLKKVTMRMVQRVTGSLLVVIALLLAAGVV
jgi:hypothetical protein